MSTSLSNLVDNLSGVYEKECKKYMERKKIRLNCEFIGFKNGRFNYKCKECKKSRMQENTILSKEAFYSEVNLENIIDKDYEHVKKVWEAFEIKDHGEYHDLYVQCDHYCLLMYLKILELSVLEYINLILLIFCLHQD